MKAGIIIALWFTVITTIAILVCSCGASKTAGCDAYGQVDTEEGI